MILGSGTFHHVYDFPHFELPFGWHIPLPESITKFMVLQLVAAALTFLIFRGLANRAAGGQPVHGWFWNFWEYLVVRLRDEVVRPVIGDPHHHDAEGHDDGFHGGAHTDSHGHYEPGHPADEYLPFILSCFFFILFCNLLGAFPWFGSATGNINVTAALALTAFGATYYFGSRVHGFVGFWTSMVPHVDAPAFVKYPLIVLLFFVESLGVLIKHGVLAVRLFCNIMGGHTVLGVILGFTAMAASHAAWWVVAPGSVLGQVGVGLLELLAAFIQAFVFSFLSTIFIGMSLHEH